MLYTGPPLPDLLLAWPRHQGRELCIQHTPLAQQCMVWWHAYASINIHPPWKRPHPTIIGYFLPFLVTLDSFLYSTVVAISCPPISSLQYVSAGYHSIQLGWDLFSKHLMNSLRGNRFQRGSFLCDSALSTLATECWRTNTGHSWHWEQCSVLWLQVLRLSLYMTCWRYVRYIRRYVIVRLMYCIQEPLSGRPLSTKTIELHWDSHG